MQKVIYGMVVAVGILGLASCKEHKPEPSCQETVQVFERNGQRVMESLNGIFLKEGFPIMGCASKVKSDDPYQKKFVVGGDATPLYWRDGRLFNSAEYAALRKEGKWPEGPSLFVSAIIRFGEEKWSKKKEPSNDWWFHPAIPHKLYPIDLLPNFSLDSPDPEAGRGPVKSKPTVYWAVRGSINKTTGNPNTTFCSMRSPPDWDGKNHSAEATKERDVEWLIQAKTYEEIMLGNTCRGNVSADNGKSIGAMIDVPGAALKDIDKIYKALATYLSEMTVD